MEIVEKINLLKNKPGNYDKLSNTYKYFAKAEKGRDGEYYISEITVRQAWNMRKQTYYYTPDEQREAEQHLDGCLWALELPWINDDLKPVEERLIPGYRS